MPAADMDHDSLKAAIESDKLVFVDFWGAHCPPCRMFAPIYDRVSDRHPDAVFAKVDTGVERELAMGFRIEAVPTLMIFREGILLFREAGAMPEKVFESVVEQAKALDMDEVREKMGLPPREGAEEAGAPESNVRPALGNGPRAAPASGPRQEPTSGPRASARLTPR